MDNLKWQIVFILIEAINSKPSMDSPHGAATLVWVMSTGAYSIKIKCAGSSTIYGFIVQALLCTATLWNHSSLMNRELDLNRQHNDIVRAGITAI